MCRSHKDGIEFKIEKCKYQGVRDITLTKKKKKEWETCVDERKQERKKLKIGRKWNMVGWGKI